MPNNSQPKDDSLETLDFIMNVLKEHEKDLDKLINDLSTVADQFGKTGEIAHKVEQVDEKITSLQKEITKLTGSASIETRGENPLLNSGKEQNKEAAQAAPIASIQSEIPAILRCKHWEDFERLAFQAQTLSFSYNEEEKIFQTGALKGNQIITYGGAIPNFSKILKIGLSKKLDVPENSVFEGILQKLS